MVKMMLRPENTYIDLKITHRKDVQSLDVKIQCWKVFAALDNRISMQLAMLTCVRICGFQTHLF